MQELNAELNDIFGEVTNLESPLPNSPQIDIERGAGQQVTSVVSDLGSRKTANPSGHPMDRYSAKDTNISKYIKADQRSDEQSSDGKHTDRLNGESELQQGRPDDTTLATGDIHSCSSKCINMLICCSNETYSRQQTIIKHVIAPLSMNSLISYKFNRPHEEDVTDMIKTR